MALFNPLQFLVLPFVFLVALPLALCAGFTTILAFLVLFLRLFLVYFDVGLETLRYVVIGNAAQSRYIASQRNPSVTPPSSAGSSPLSSPGTASSRYRYRRKRHGSNSNGPPLLVGGMDGVALGSSSGLDRDFEGIGGWRLDSVDVDAGVTNDQQWYNLNSRLEVPDRRHHFRSQSGGAVLSEATPFGWNSKAGSRRASQSPEGMRMTTSPNSSRSRTPTNVQPQGLTKLDDHGYFPLVEGRPVKKVSV
ncbi:hypothetical protein F4780DRAFT_179025 [Xylariomycetidae sp. FL0641]|nr:hypothetical protein F4780DRAFT_179025 [Xylariomycetidae sp. FL0641]